MKNKNILEKDSLMFLVILGLWLSILLYFDLKIFAYIRPEESLLATFSIVGFTACINIFWLYGIYHLAILIFSFFPQKFSLKLIKPLEDCPKAAILYLTMNDFSQEAILSCLNQDYPDFDVYICDDSTDEAFKSQIDNFVSAHQPQAKLIRRGTRHAYKAGNINYALGKIHQKYKYFAISDADGIIPKDFLNKLIPYFSLDDSIAFAEANEKVNPKQKEVFARDFSFFTNVHWSYYPPVKQKFGFLMFYGHGSVIRTDVWKEIGGFPETITEDIAFSSLLRERGYQGVFVKDVVCYEDFPKSFVQYLKRNERWIKGTTEYLIRWFPSLLRSKKVPWFEKLDVVISAGVLLNAPIFMFFLFLVCIALPYSTKHFGLHIPLVATFTPLYESAQAYGLGIRHYVNWSFPFFLVMLVTGCGQLIPIAIHSIRQPGKMFRCMAEFTFICLSTLPIYTINFISFLITKRSYFHVTGEMRSPYFENRQKFKNVSIIDILIAVFLIYTFITTSNLWLLSISLALIVNPFLYKFDWETPGINLFIYIPFILILITLFLIGLSFL